MLALLLPLCKLLRGKEEVQELASSVASKDTLKGNVLKGEVQEMASILGSRGYAPEAKRGTIGQMNVAQ